MTGKTYKTTYQKERKRAKISQERLAEMLDVSRDTICKWEYGMRCPDVEELAQLSDIFGCDMAYLAGTQKERVKAYKEYGKYTGLTDEAVKALHESAAWDPITCSIISDLIESGEIIKLIKDARQADFIGKSGIEPDEMKKEKQLRELIAWEAIRRFMGDF